MKFPAKVKNLQGCEMLINVSTNVLLSWKKTRIRKAMTETMKPKLDCLMEELYCFVLVIIVKYKQTNKKSELNTTEA